MSEAGPLLEIRSLSKTFPGQMALSDASLTALSGQVHALVGQNGSGKSTMIKILAGYHNADAGADIRMQGRPVDLSALGPEDRNRLRIMHQDLALVDSLSVTENLALGRGFRTGRGGRIAWRAEHLRAADHLDKFGVDIDPRTPVAGLGPAQRAMVGLVRAVQDWEGSSGILVLDEPTALLPRPEVEQLFAVVRRVAASGTGILFVSHRLDEVFELADQITVLRDGRTIRSVPAHGVDHDALVSLIVGSAVASHAPTSGKASTNEPVLSAERLWGSILSDVSFDVRAGEVVGVAGIAGSGREELAGLLAGEHELMGGAIRIQGQNVRGGCRGAIRMGVGYVPADRIRKGSDQAGTVASNILLGSATDRRRHRWWVTRRDETVRARPWLERLDIRPAIPHRRLSLLSGGNQQKTVIARSLRRRPVIMVCDEPTQGVDVGAKATIYQLLAEVAADGRAVLVCSSDAEELAMICDRVLVLRDGCLGEPINGTITPAKIVEAVLR